MKSTLNKYILIILGMVWVVNSSAQQKNTEIFFYKQNERKSGVLFNFENGREELRTGNSFNYEELKSGTASFLFENRYWKFLDYKQEQFNFEFNIGPATGWGTWDDSSSVNQINANQTVFGLRTNMQMNYANRYYWDRKNYTIVQINAWGRYDLYNRVSEGIVIDSNLVSSDYNKSDNREKLRYGIQAKAGWGFGRFNPMNYYMIADYLLQKYYKGRNFAEKEIISVADEIGRIKQNRDYRLGHNKTKEVKELQKFITEKMLLSTAENIIQEWQTGEFLPRFSGVRAEIGPWFRYYNREPDFLYGGYLKLEKQNYKNYKWNSNTSASLNYSRYKRNDWMLLELDFGWSYYSMLKSQFDFGVKYIPGVVLNNFTDIQQVRHNLIPYWGYFTQINQNTRLKFNFAYRIADHDQFMISGPQFSLEVYRSRY